jgi:RNA polymerase sigma-70 factor (ECF subfamily)
MSGAFINSLPPLFGVSDEQAMWRVKMQDDAQSFVQLVERWQKPIQSLCARMTGDLHRAEDLAQETFARIFARRKEYEPSGKFGTYLWRVALNICYDELRKVNRRRESALEMVKESGQETLPVGEVQMVAETAAPDSALIEQERAEAVRCALLQLAEPYRAVVVLRHYEGLKFREIGEVLEIPEGTVKSRMAEALNQLNQLLTDHERDTSCKTKNKTRPEIPVI